MIEKTNENISPLKAFWALRYKGAYKILNFLLQSAQLRAKGARWKKILEHIKDVPQGTLHGTLTELVKEGLVQKYLKKKDTIYRITPLGLWALKRYEELSVGPQLEKVPKVVQELMAIRGYDILLPAQRDFIQNFFPPKNNLLILASPSAGKTFLAKCCMLEKLRTHKKIIYLTPYKALNRQKYELFKKVFEQLGYSVKRVDGDTYTPLDILSKADIVVSTYERAMGGMLRDEEWVKNASLAIIDEITLLRDKSRGANLDLLLTFLKQKMQIITLSSHVGNSKQLREWLNAEIFEYTPKELTREFIIKEDKNRVFLEDRDGTDRIVRENVSVLKFIFEHMNRKEGETAIVLVGPRAMAQELAKEASALSRTDLSSIVNKIGTASDEVTPLVEELIEVVRKGVAFHHAGLTHRVREYIEDLLNERKITTVVSTPTLSHGVDFPIDHAIIYLDSFEFKKAIDDLTLFPGLSKIEYVQYRGRASRLMKSKGGNVYIVSDRIPRRTIDSIRKNFLAKKIEDVFPPELKVEIIDWIVLLQARDEYPISKAKLIEKSFEFVKETLAFQAMDKDKKKSELWRKKLGRSIERLKKQGFLKATRRGSIITELGLKVADINLTPIESLHILKNMKLFEKRAEHSDIINPLLVLVSGVGMLRDFNGKRLKSFVLAFRQYCRRHKKPLPLSDFMVECQAKAWVLNSWINEKSITEITTYPAFRGVVYDDDVPRLGRYASMEMMKISALAKMMGFKRVAEVADNLAVRLKRGVKQELICKEDLIDLFRLPSMGRTRARILYNNGYKTLIDILSVIFDKGEEAFCRTCGLKPDEAAGLLEELRALFKADTELRVRCKSL